jgi:cytochrome-b5 reductase
MAKCQWRLLAAVLLCAPHRFGAQTEQGSGCQPGARERFHLLQKFEVSHDSRLLRFKLPRACGRRLPPSGDDGTFLAPTGVYCIANVTSPSGGDEMLRKSYSPVSLPDADEHLDLLVKAYPPRPGGGLGSKLCALQPGESILMEIKPPRAIHGSPVVAGRWKKLGLIGGGTGIAPLIQIVRFLLAAPADTTEIWLLSINRHEGDILMREELERLEQSHPRRLHLAFSLTKPPIGWRGAVGRGDVAMAAAFLPAPGLTVRGGSDAGDWGEGAVGRRREGPTDTMVMVCGTDGFVETWAGPLERRADTSTGKSVKLQGPLKGILAAAGFDEASVYKF